MLALAALGVFEPLPKLQVANELGFLVVEFLVRSVSRLLVFEWPITHLLHAECRRDDQHLGQRLAMPRFKNHAAHTRIERQARELAADGSELVVVVDRTEFGEQLVAIGDGAARRRLDEGKVFNGAEPERRHPQDHAGERCTQYFWVGEARPGVEIGFVIEANADAVAHPPATARALVGCGLAHRLDQQLLDLVAIAVALDARGAGIDDELNARHGERGFSHVGGQHDAARAVRFKDAVLLLLREPRKQRHDLNAWRVMLAQMVSGLTYLSLAGQEHKHVARAFAPELIDGRADRVVQVELAGPAAGPPQGRRAPLGGWRRRRLGGIVLFKRPPALLYGKQAPRDLDDRRRPIA